MKKKPNTIQKSKQIYSYQTFSIQVKRFPYLLYVQEVLSIIMQVLYYENWTF